MFNEQEKGNLEEIDKILNESNEYVSIAPGSSKILQFILTKKIDIIPKVYNENPFKQFRFTVIEQNGDSKEKIFDVGKKSARMITSKLKDGHTLLKVERIGSGKDTLYIPTIV